MIFAATLASDRYSSLGATFREIANEGMPAWAPSSAAATVPEYRTFEPQLRPLLIPLTTMSGRPPTSSVRASFTASAGLPLTLQQRGATVVTRSGEYKVSALEAPLRGPSGAQI